MYLSAVHFPHDQSRWLSSSLALYIYSAQCILGGPIGSDGWTDGCMDGWMHPAPLFLAHFHTSPQPGRLFLSRAGMRTGHHRHDRGGIMIKGSAIIHQGRCYDSSKAVRSFHPRQCDRSIMASVIIGSTCELCNAPPLPQAQDGHGDDDQSLEWPLPACLDLG